MIALSWVFLGAAIVTLVTGVAFTDDLLLVWISIGSSALALIFLLAGILRRRPVQPATAGAPYGPSAEEAAARGRPAAAAPVAAPHAPPAAPTPQAAPPPEQRRPAPPPAPPAPAPAAPTEAPAEAPAATAPARKKAAAKKPAAKKTAAKKPAAKKAAAKKPAAKKTAASASTRTSVVAIPERGTFHKATCRYVKDRDDTERVQLGTARNRGYTACGVCKPEGG